MSVGKRTESPKEAIDWSSQVLFCDDNIVAVAEVVKTFVNNLHLESICKILLDRYSRMKKWYGKACANDSEWEQTGCIIADTRRHKDVLLGIPRSLFAADNEMWCGENGILGREDVGLDLPTWMDLKGSKKAERIMIVASEPKRAIHTSENLWLSSPWAFHSKDYRDDQINQLVRTIVESFMRDRQAVVYLTDYRKIYDADGIAQKGYGSEYQKCLEKEISLFKPTVMIGYGSNAYRALKTGLKGRPKYGFSHMVCNGPYEDEYDGGIQTLVFAHPSSLNACHDCIWSKMKKTNDGISRKDALLKYYTEWS